MVMRSDSQFAQSARLAELDEKVSVTLLLFLGGLTVGCGSEMFIRDPDFLPSRIPYPTKKEEGKQ